MISLRISPIFKAARWITVHGTHVQVDDSGKVKEGPKNLTGKPVNNLPKSKPTAKPAKPEKLPEDRPSEKPTFTPQETAAVNDYTGGIAFRINGNLRSGAPLTGQMKEVDEGLQKAFAKVPVGEPQTVFRGIQVGGQGADAFAQQAKEAMDSGKPLHNAGYMSTTKNEADMAGTPVSMKIVTPQGLDVSGISKNAEEQEVLINRGSDLKINKVERRPDGGWHIEAEHIPGKKAVACLRKSPIYRQKSFDESKHPRDDSGKFGEGGAGGEGSEKPETASKPESKLPRATKPKSTPAAVPKNNKDAGKAMADALATVRPEVASDPALHAKVAANWAKELKGRLIPSGPDYDELEAGVKANLENKDFAEVVALRGPQSVILVKGEGGRRAESVGASVLVHSHASDPIKHDDSPPVPGMATSEEGGGIAAVLRHEYAHRVFGQIGESGRKQWEDKARELYPEPEEIKKELTSYAGTHAGKSTSREEVFTEAFAVGTSPSYDASKFPPRARELIDFTLATAKGNTNQSQPATKSYRQKSKDASGHEHSSETGQFTSGGGGGAAKPSKPENKLAKPSHAQAEQAAVRLGAKEFSKWGERMLGVALTGSKTDMLKQAKQHIDSQVERPKQSETTAGTKPANNLPKSQGPAEQKSVCPIRKTAVWRGILIKGDKGRWITIGGKKGEGGKRSGGSPVYVENGRITRGAPSLAGRKIAALKEKPEARPELTGNKRQQAGQKAGQQRQENESARGYSRAKWGKQAKEQGHKAQHLHQLAAEFMAHDKAHKDDVTSMLQHVRKTHPHMRALTAQGAFGRIDASNVKMLDDIADELSHSKQWGHVFPKDADPEHHLFDLLSAGNPEHMTEDEAYESALEELNRSKASEANYQPDDEEPIPF